MSIPIWAWVAFNVFVLAMLALDLGVVHRRAHVVGLREALTWSFVWIALALAFNVVLYVWHGTEPALAFLAGYLIEKSLSVDNMFVFWMLFSYFRVPALYQHKVLFWGIVSALVMRAVLIYLGITVLQRFHWVVYVLGAFLLFTALHMLRHESREIHPERNPVLRAVRRVLPVSATYDDGKFFTRQGKRRLATPLLVVLVAIETTDLAFALDSIPAILAVTRDPFIVYSSNVFAILGLRALYFALAGLVRLFAYLHYGLAAILAFVGAKMLLSDVVHIPVAVALGVVAGILLVAVLASVRRRGPVRAVHGAAPEPEAAHPPASPPGG